MVRGTTDAEVMEQAAAHAADAHGMHEVDDGTAAALRDAIHDA